MWFALVTVEFMLGGALLAAGASKLRSRAAVRDFAASIRALDLLRGRAAAALAVAVGVAEVGVAALVAAPTSAGAVPRWAGPAGALVLLVAFTVVVARAVARGSGASCRCFGSSGGPLRADHLWRNAILIVAAGCALAGWWLAPATPASVDAWLGTAFAAVAGVGLALPVVYWDGARFLAGRS
ncbi:MauE/DoxX family redox-associated membrane protein [Catellatospora sp. NPDC049609]|uniref:MauE/DoxX family redox-associated membrane protein n=1 Tax=Catellatospora sp. NPDC049609 TaxID=3155505 RepID=UPI00343A753F